MISEKKGSMEGGVQGVRRVEEWGEEKGRGRRT